MVDLKIIAVAMMLMASGPAMAMTGQEFLQVYDDDATSNTSDYADSLKPLVRKFVAEGYKHVPDWSMLGELTHALILENGIEIGS